MLNYGGCLRNHQLKTVEFIPIEPHEIYQCVSYLPNGCQLVQDFATIPSTFCCFSFFLNGDWT